MKTPHTKKLPTLLAHLADFGDDPHAASLMPIYQSATYDLKKQSRYDYMRSGNPTRETLEKALAACEGGVAAFAVHTGIGAIALVLEVVLKSGDAILVDEDVYGGTYRLLKIWHERHGITVHYADLTDLKKTQQLLAAHTIRLVLTESPTNPQLKVVDLPAVAKLAKKAGALFAVDNSLATFASQQPLMLGADISFSSLTKYVSGHGATIAGLVAVKDPVLAKRCAYMVNAEGRSLHPYDCFLVSLGLPTLPARLAVHAASAKKIVAWLSKQKQIKNIRYPTSALAKKQMKFLPGIVTFDAATPKIAQQLIRRTKLFGQKVSFGTADSRIETPATMSHATFAAADLARLGITAATVRLSIGLEDVDDLINDLATALKH